MPNASRFNYIQFKRYLNEKAKKKLIRFVSEKLFSQALFLLALIPNCKRTKRKQTKTRAEMQQSNIKFLVGDYITRRAFFLILNSSREKVKHQDLLLFCFVYYYSLNLTNLIKSHLPSFFPFGSIRMSSSRSANLHTHLYALDET